MMRRTPWFRSLTLVAALATASVAEAFGLLGWIGGTSIWEVLAKYPTDFMYTNATQVVVWGTLGCFEVAFAVYQLVHRADPLVASIQLPFVGACLSDTAWTITLCFELLWLAWLATVVWTASLLTIFFRLGAWPKSAAGTRFWSLYFPLTIHAAFSLLFGPATLCLAIKQSDLGWFGMPEDHSAPCSSRSCPGWGSQFSAAGRAGRSV